MAAVDQHHVVAGGLEDFRTVCEVIRHQVHVSLGHAVDVVLLGDLIAVDDAGAHLVDSQAPGLPALTAVVGLGEGDHAAVIELLAGQGAAGMDGPGNLRQFGLVFRGDGKGSGDWWRRAPGPPGWSPQGDHGVAAPGLSA